MACFIRWTFSHVSLYNVCFGWSGPGIKEGSKGQRKSCVLRTITFCCVHALPLSFFIQGQVVLKWNSLTGFSWFGDEGQWGAGRGDWAVDFVGTHCRADLKYCTVACLVCTVVVQRLKHTKIASIESALSPGSCDTVVISGEDRYSYFRSVLQF